MTGTLTGIDRLGLGEGPRLQGVRVAVLCHPASVASDLRHLFAVLEGVGASVVSRLGPEHGIDAAAQDMESVPDQNHGITPTYSLYGEDVSSLRPSGSMFHDAEWLICDLQDIGVRYYTYAWTAVQAVEAALHHGLKVLILDRPNPLGGLDAWVEGGTVAAGQESFVGFHPVAVRHGLTLAELVSLTVEERGLVDPRRMEVLTCAGWRRSQMFPDTGGSWVLPSPNMPTFETALVYGGQCLFEGTTLSEGRGTTRPFEICGAPWVDPEALVRAIRPEDHPGLGLRPLVFRPMFHKHAGQTCKGVQLHIHSPTAVRSLRTSWALLGALWRLGEGAMGWRSEPYEFVADRLAIDLLAGGPWLRHAVESGVHVTEMVRSQEADRLGFIARRRRFLLYDP